MAKKAGGNAALISFNRGLLSELGLARTDLKRTAMSAQIMNNWVPRTLGSMSFRAGLQYIDHANSNNYALYIPFIFSLSDTALIEMTDSTLRFRVNEQLITRVSVATATTNGNFTGNITSWTDNSDAGGSTAWVTGNFLGITGSGQSSGRSYQAVTVAGGDVGKEHALRIVVTRGNVTLGVGTALGASEYINNITLGTGTHSLAFTPTGTFYIQLSDSGNYVSLVQSVNIEAAGVVSLPSPWNAASMPMVRYDQSADEIFCSCDGIQQQIIQRFSTRSWSIILYEPQDGPFNIINTGSISLTATAISGDTTITASAPLFNSTQVGALFKVSSVGQIVANNLSGNLQFTDPIQVTGLSVSSGRLFNITIAGTWAGTLFLQRSVGSVGNWVNVGTSWTSNIATTFNDGFDNQIIFYRIGFTASSYVSGTANVTLSYAAGSIDGIFKITSYASPTSVGVRVLKSLGSTTASNLWHEGLWSNFRGWPSAVAFHQGRLWWAGKNQIVGSVSDAYTSFDETNTTDSGPISQQIGSGPVDTISWLLSLIRMEMGGQMREFSCMSSSLDEPLTAANFNLKSPSGQGSAPVQAKTIDYEGVFVQRSGTRLFNLTYNVYTYQYVAEELTQYVPEIGNPGIVRIDVQRKPDTRVHCVLGDGTVALLIYDKIEEVSCFVKVVAANSGFIEDVVVMPGSVEDTVYYSVRRIVNGSTVRYLEKWSLESDNRGGTLSKNMDAHIVYQGSATATITGLSHLEGQTVVCWGDGIPQGTTFTVTGGQITLPTAVSNAVVGLPYQAVFQSTKLTYFSSGGTALTMTKRVNHLGLVLAYTHCQGLQFGSDLQNLLNIPSIYKGGPVAPNTVFQSYDDDPIEFPGALDPDSRVWLVANSPLPCTMLAGVIEMETYG